MSELDEKKEASLADFRAQFSTARMFVPLNNAGTALLTRNAREILKDWANRFYDEGVYAVPPAYQAVEGVRQNLARFLGSSVLSFFPNTASAISQVALGLSLKPDDEILIWDQEYPSSHYPWQEAAARSGAKLILAPSGPSLETPVETLTRLCTDRTKVIAFSWVQFRSGAVTDLEAITKFARSRGIFTCADVIQGVGVRPFHFERSGLDAACGGSHKWLCSVPSAAYLCLREENLEKLRPVVVGAHTFGTSEDKPNANARPKAAPSRFEPGSQGLLDILSLGASIEVFQNTGIDVIAQEAERLAKRLVDGLESIGYRINSPHGEAFQGAIVNFSPTKDSRYGSLEQLSARLRAERISFAERPPGIRLSCHAFNTDFDIKRVLLSLEA